MGKFDNLLYDCKIQLNEALDGEPQAEDLIDPDDPSKTFKASGFNYYPNFKPENKEDKDLHNQKAKLVNAIIQFERDYKSTLFTYRIYDDEIAKIYKEFYAMYNSISVAT